MAERVAVIGGGPMGLAAAYQLVRDGARPVVFEADDRPGGMAASDDFNGLRLERYYHYHCLSDDPVFEMLGELGLRDRLRWVSTRMGYWAGGRLQDWGSPWSLLRFRGLGLIPKLRYGLHALACTRRRQWRDLDGLEASSWVRGWVGEEAYELLWRRLFDLKFYDYAHSLSAAWIWSRVWRMGRSRGRFGYLEGGTDTLLDGLVRAITGAGGELRLSTPVEKVRLGRGRALGVRVDGEDLDFDRVISTVPLPFVPRLLPDLPGDWLERCRSVRNIAVVCVVAQLRRPLTPYFWLNTSDPDLEIPGLIEYSNLRPLDRAVVYAPFYVPGEHALYREPDAAFDARLRRALRRINPGLAEDDILAVRVSRYRHAQPVCGPGFLDTLPAMLPPVDALVVADTSYYYPEDRSLAESIRLGRRLAGMGRG